MKTHQFAKYVAVGRRKADEAAEFYKDPRKFDPDYYVDPDFPDDPPRIFGIMLAEDVFAPDLFDFFEAGDDLDDVVRQVMQAISGSPLFAAEGALAAAIDSCGFHLWRRAAEVRSA